MLRICQLKKEKKPKWAKLKQLVAAQSYKNDREPPDNLTINNATAKELSCPTTVVWGVKAHTAIFGEDGSHCPEPIAPTLSRTPESLADDQGRFRRTKEMGGILRHAKGLSLEPSGFHHRLHGGLTKFSQKKAKDIV